MRKLRRNITSTRIMTLPEEIHWREKRKRTRSSLGLMPFMLKELRIRDTKSQLWMRKE